MCVIINPCNIRDGAKPRLVTGPVGGYLRIVYVSLYASSVLYLKPPVVVPVGVYGGKPPVSSVPDQT